MRRIACFLTLGLTFAALAPAQEKFSQRLTSDERKAAGLDQLSAEQIAMLDALVDRDRHAPVAKPATMKRAAPVAESVPADAPVEKKSRMFGLPAKDEETAITARLAGEFRGWNGTTAFHLDNGQIWVQTDSSDIRQIAPRQSPGVKIEKSMFGGYKLIVEGEPTWVRVKRLQ